MSLRVLVIALCLLQGSALAQLNHTSLYWNPQESGWGLSVSQQGDIVFATLYVYDRDRRPTWYAMSRGSRMAPATERFAGELYRAPRQNGTMVAELVGDMEIQFGADGRGQLSYRVGEARVTKAIEKFAFGGTPPVCRMVTAARGRATNYQDIWWNADDPGWGVHLAHQRDTIFATVYTSAADGQPTWFTMSAGLRQVDGSFVGDLYRVTTGSPFDAATYQPIGPGSATKAGTLRLSFSDGERGTFDGEIDGVRRVIPITRFAYSSPQADCSELVATRAYANQALYSPGADDSLASAVEEAAVSEMQVTIDGVRHAIVATAGHLTAANPQGGAGASMFYVAYVEKERDPRTRPIVFVYNGGPGNSTAVLHLGSFGPSRLETNAPAIDPAGNFALVANAESLLDVADLVFVDAIGTGYSQAIAPNRNRDFWGVGSDADVFRDFVRRYVEVNGRVESPRFLLGESYGGIRGAVLARRLEQAGLPVAGVIFQSPIMDYNANCTVAPVSCAWFLPSYASVSAWHGRLSPAPANVRAFLDDTKMFATAQYDPAIRSLMQTGMQPTDAIITALVERTGTTQALWRTSFNLNPAVYRTSLVANQVLGRYDARVTAAVGSEPARGDPSDWGIAIGFSEAIEPYLASLGYTARSPYAYQSGAGGQWVLAHDGNARPDAVPDLAAAMTLNPRMRVFAMAGYHDLATPFQLTERDLARLDAPARVSVRGYAGGHRISLDGVSRPLQRRDLSNFIRGLPLPTTVMP